MQAHVTGDDQIRFGVALQNARHIPIETGLNMVRERLTELGIIAPENPIPTPADS